MFVIANIINKIVLYIASTLALFLVSVLDWYTGTEISFSVFYLFPLSFFALYKTVGRMQLIVNAVTATVLWFLADSSATVYTYPTIPYWNAFVRLIYFVVISQLLFTLKQTNRRLVETNDHLKKLNEEKNKFLGIAAHDLRNPIGAILSYSKILLNDGGKKMKKADREKIYALINKSSGHSLHIVENVLDISSINAGKIDLHFQRYEYLDVVKQSIHINNLLAAKKHITIKLKTSSKKILAEFDRHYITEVLDNLLTNAVKYSHQKSSVIVRVSAEKEHVVTDVIDTGVGIPEDEIGKLFSPFQTGSSKPTSGESSTGLGLAIVKNIIAHHHGTITVHSKPSKGSTFSVRLPLKQLSVS